MSTTAINTTTDQHLYHGYYALFELDDIKVAVYVAISKDYKGDTSEKAKQHIKLWKVLHPKWTTHECIGATSKVYNPHFVTVFEISNVSEHVYGVYDHVRERCDLSYTI